MSELVPLTKEQARYAERGLTVVEMLARVFARQWPTIPREDFVSVGHEAVVRAATRFEPTRGLRFEQFARHAIWGAMLDLAHHEKFVVQQTVRAIAGAMREVPELEVSMDTWLDAPSASPQAETIRELRARAAELVAKSFACGTRVMTSPEEIYVEEEARQGAISTLRATLLSLSDDERAFVRDYYEDEQTLEAIAARRGVVKRTVQRLHDRIKQRLAEALARDGDG